MFAYCSTSGNIVANVITSHPMIAIIRNPIIILSNLIM